MQTSLFLYETAAQNPEVVERYTFIPHYGYAYLSSIEADDDYEFINTTFGLSSSLAVETDSWRKLAEVLTNLDQATYVVQVHRNHATKIENRSQVAELFAKHLLF